MIFPILIILLVFFIIIGIAYCDDYPTFSIIMMICTGITLIAIFITCVLYINQKITTENFSVERKTYIEDDIYKTKYLITLENGDILITDQIEITNKNELIYRKNPHNSLDMSVKSLSINSDVATELGLLS